MIIIGSDNSSLSMMKEGMLRWWDLFERLEFPGKHDPTSFINTSSGKPFYYMHAVRINEEHGGICDEVDEDLGTLVT